MRSFLHSLLALLFIMSALPAHAHENHPKPLTAAQAEAIALDLARLQRVAVELAAAQDSATRQRLFVRYQQALSAHVERVGKPNPEDAQAMEQFHAQMEKRLGALMERLMKQIDESLQAPPADPAKP